MTSTSLTITIPAGRVALEGDLQLVRRSAGVILFAHGSGSSRFSPRNQFVAKVLREQGLSTLLFDLLTREEEILDARTGQLRFDIALLASRLIFATTWAKKNEETATLDIGYFGASTGAAAALIAATNDPGAVKAIVSRGGRPDLAREALPSVKAPTLLIVGGFDLPVIDMNRTAFEQLTCRKEMVIVPGASHLFEEPGALEKVAGLAADFFRRHL